MRLLASIIALLIFLPAAQAQVRSWHVKLADGSGTKLEASANSGMIDFRNSKGVAFSIPAASITHITHFTHRVPRSTKAHDRLESMCCAGANTDMLSLLAGAIAAPLGSSKEHYVEVRWQKEVEGTVLLEVAKDVYLRFMDWLQQQSGTKWRDLEQERERAVRAMYARGRAAFPVTIRFPNPNGSYSAHSYAALPLDDNDSTELFIFSGEVKPRNLVAIAPVTREWSMNTCVFDVEVLYGKCDEHQCDIQAVLLPTLTYWVARRPSQPVVNNTTSQHESACDTIREQKKAGNRAWISSDKNLTENRHR